MNIENYVFQIYKGKNGEIHLIIDTFVPDKHFLITFRNDNDLDKFVQFLKSPIVEMI